MIHVITINIGPCQHKLGDWTVTKNATCTEDGIKSRKCTLCGKTETETIAKTGHKYQNTVVKPTCTEQGYTFHKCSNCKNEYKDTYVNATGHKFGDWTVTKNATCTEDGSKSRKCTLCGKTETSTIAKTGIITVTFNANGGSVSKGNKTVTYNATYGELPTPTRTGYTFNGWYTSASGGNKVDANTKVTITGNQTIYAQWKAKAVTVTFFRNNDKNDKSSVKETFTYGVANQKFGYKTDGTGRYTPMNPANIGFGGWSKTGYEMLGWSSDRNAKSAEHYTYSDVSVSSQFVDSKSPSTNLYAIWKANNYTITFNANGGNVSINNKTVTYDSTYGELPTPTRTGYTFIGWYDLGDKIDSYTKVTITKNQTLYAWWEENSYSVYFDENGGNYEGGTCEVAYAMLYGSTYGELPAVTREGYIFNGWYTEKTGGTKINPDTRLTIASNHTLYAQWKATDDVGHAMTEKEAAGQTISDGDYWIYSGLDVNYFLDIPGNKIITNNANVQLWDWNYGMPSKYDVWTVKYLNNGFYKISQYGTNICLDVVDASNLSNTNVQIYKDNGNAAQQWSISKTETGYRIQSKCNGFYLDVAEAKVARGTNVRVSKKNDNKCQNFCFIPYVSDERPIEDGVYGIQSSIDSGYYVDASGNTSDFKNGTNICLGDKMYDTFRVEYSGDGYYKIFEATTGLAITTNSGNGKYYINNGRNIELLENSDIRGQLWKIRKTSDGHYFIISKLNGYYFELAYAKLEKGQNIGAVYYIGGNAQKWNFVSPVIKGDANGDGIVNVSDAVMLQKWLLCYGDLTKWQNVDLCEDGRIDTFDMVEMRKLLIQNK